jgi:hypothetical protein
MFLNVAFSEVAGLLKFVGLLSTHCMLRHLFSQFYTGNERILYVLPTNFLHCLSVYELLIWILLSAENWFLIVVVIVVVIAVAAVIAPEDNAVSNTTSSSTIPSLLLTTAVPFLLLTTAIPILTLATAIPFLLLATAIPILLLATTIPSLLGLLTPKICRPAEFSVNAETFFEVVYNLYNL